MVAVVHGRLDLGLAWREANRAGQEDPAEHRHAVQIEAELGRDPRQREEEHPDRADEPDPIAFSG